MNEQGIRFAISADDRATRVFAGVRKELQSVEGAAGSLRSVLSAFAPTVAAAFSLAAITAFVRNTVNGIDALNDLADATGSSVENLSALEDVAARTGTSMDTVGGAVIKLNKTLADAKPGSDQAKALEAIGLSAKELRAIDPAEALLRTAQALAGYADDGNKARLVQELFGKSLREVAPLLKDLAESGKLNATVTTEQARQAEAFNQQLFRFQKNATDAARAISGPLVASLNDFFGVVRKLNANKGGFFAGVADQFNVDFLRARLTASKEEIDRLAPGAERARALLAVQPDSIRAKATLAEFTQLQKAADDYGKKIDAILYGGQGRRPANEGGGRLRAPQLPDLVGSGGGSGGRAAAERIKSVAPIIDPATTDALRALENTDVGKIARLNAQLTELFTLQRETRGSSAVAEAIAKTRDELEKLDPAAVAAAKSAEALKAILAQTPTGKLKSVLIDIDLINAAFKNGADNPEQWAEAIRVSTSRLGSEGQGEIEKLSTFAEQAARNIQDALGTTLESALNGNFEGIGQMWGNLLIRMAAQAAAAQLNEFLFGSLFGGSGKGPGVIGAFFGLSGARADGGPVSAGGAYLVGERGPEIFKPSSSGTVLPNGVGMGGSVNIYQTINVGQGVSRGEVYAAAMQAKDLAKAEIMQTLYRTGRGAYA